MKNIKFEKLSKKVLIKQVENAIDITNIKTKQDKTELLQYIHTKNKNILCKLNLEKDCDDNKNYKDNLVFFEVEQYIFDKNILAICDNKKTILDIDEYKKLQKYIKTVLDDYKTENLYIVIGGGYMYDFYFPLFIREYLTKNPDKTFTILIYGYNYNSVPQLYKLYTNFYNFEYSKVLKIIENIRLNNPDIIDRIKIIHVNILFELPLFEPYFNKLLNIIKCKNGYNIIYFGRYLCGLIFTDSRESIHILYKSLIPNYIFIGCDGMFYGKNNIKLK